MTVSYFDHFIRFCYVSQRGIVPVPRGCVEMADDDLDACFITLKQGVDVFVWTSHGIRYLANYLFSHFIYVKAAGGLVSEPEGKHLLIFREGCWDIPKGMVEKGESIAHAAMREVGEETGIHDVALGPIIDKTYHIYDKYGGWHLKQTSWYHMTTSMQSATNPQSEEGITQAVWLSHSECVDKLSHSFASLQHISKLI